MKSLTDIYNSITKNFKDNTQLDIAEGTVIDSFVLASATGIEEAHKEIENNKNPHIYTKLTGSNIDGVGMLVGCLRQPNESDTNYLYRVINWNTSNQASNLTAINNAVINMEHASNVTYIPLTQGVATGTAYIIPKSLDPDVQEKAIQETKDRLAKVLSQTSYTEYVIPKILYVDIYVYMSVYKDEQNVKENISKKFEEYINNIAPGDKFEIGQLNRIGISEQNVSYFAVSNVIIDGKEMQDIDRIQVLEEKLVFNKINWNMVVNN